MKRRGLSAVIGVLVALFASQAASGVTVLLLTDSSGSLTTVESNIKTNLQAAGYTVNTLWDGDSQANYTAAFATITTSSTYRAMFRPPTCEQNFGPARSAL